jgi:hypothetical protein
LSVHRIEAAAGPDGTFAIVRMAPCFPGSVKIDSVKAARPNAVLTPAAVASKATWTGLVWVPRPADVLQLLQCGERPGCGSPGRPGMAPAGSPLWGRRADWGGSVIFDLLTGGLRGLCRVDTSPVRTPWHPIGARLGRAIAQQVGSFVGSCVVKICSKKSDYQSGRPDLNRRPLDPQSRSLRRWTSPGVAQRALDQARQSPGVAGCRLMSACVGS